MDITVILDDLANGRIDTAEAKKRIDGLGISDPSDPEPEVSAEWPTTPPVVDEPIVDAEIIEEVIEEEPEDPGHEAPFKADKINGVSKILVKATGRKVKIIADPQVSTAAAEDVHQVRRSGTTLEIRGDKEFTGVVDAISWARSLRSLDDVRALGIGKEMTVRVNPALVVDIELTGSSLVVSEVPHIGKVRLTAGSATMTGARCVSDLVLQAGQATICGLFTEGWSRIRCESGQVVVDVDPTSDVVLRADAQLGRVTWEGKDDVDGELTLGAGTAHLDVGVVIGHAAIKIGDLR